MTNDEKQKYHHNANEGETRAPDAQTEEPHHALNTPVAATEVAASDEAPAEHVEDVSAGSTVKSADDASLNDGD
jgi:hypothetical protein